MRRDILCQNTKNFNQRIEIHHFSSGFCRMPDALFHIPEELGIQGWKVRFIVGLSYLYALSFNKGKAVTTQKELMKILETNSYSTINSFITKTNELFEKLRTEAENTGVVLNEGEFITRKGRKGGTQCYLIDQTIIAESFRHKVSHGGTFAFYNIALLLPISAQAKAILLYLHRKARNGSLLNGKAEAEVSARELARVLTVGKGRLRGYLLELEEAKVIERVNNGKRLRFRITKLDEWNKEAILHILHNWKGHPFIRNWKFTVEPINPSTASNEATCEPSPMGRQKNSNGATDEKTPIGRHKNSNRETKLSGNSPIGRHKNSNRETHRNKSKEENKTIEISKEYDDIYNGGGEKNNIKNLFNSKKEIKKEETNGCEISQKLVDRNNAPSYRPNGLKNKKKAGEGELGKSNKAVKLEERIDKQELERIKEVLAQLEKRVNEALRYNRVEVAEELYKPLKQVYGDKWKVLAGMYELMNKVAPKYGYSRNVNRNYVGLLLSFVLKDSQASFWDFYDRFKRVFGVKEKERKRERKDLFEKLKDFLRKHFSPTLYKTWIEEGLIGVMEETDGDGKKIVKCKDWVVKEYLGRHYVDLFSEFFGETNWKFE